MFILRVLIDLSHAVQNSSVSTISVLQNFLEKSLSQCHCDLIYYLSIGLAKGVKARKCSFRAALLHILEPERGGPYMVMKSRPGSGTVRMTVRNHY